MKSWLSSRHLAPIWGISILACGGISEASDVAGSSGATGTSHFGGKSASEAGATQITGSGGSSGPAGGRETGGAAEAWAGSTQAAGSGGLREAAAVCSTCSAQSCSVQLSECQQDQGCQDIVRCVQTSCRGGQPSCSSGCIGADGSAFMALNLFACVSQKCGKVCIDLAP